MSKVDFFQHMAGMASFSFQLIGRWQFLCSESKAKNKTRNLSQSKSFSSVKIDDWLDKVLSLITAKEV